MNDVFNERLFACEMSCKRFACILKENFTDKNKCTLLTDNATECFVNTIYTTCVVRFPCIVCSIHILTGLGIQMVAMDKLLKSSNVVLMSSCCITPSHNLANTSVYLIHFMRKILLTRLIHYVMFLASDNLAAR